MFGALVPVPLIEARVVVSSQTISLGSGFVSGDCPFCLWLAFFNWVLGGAVVLPFSTSSSLQTEQSFSFCFWYYSRALSRVNEKSVVESSHGRGCTFWLKRF